MAKVLSGKETKEQLVVSADKTQAYGLSGNDTLISDNKSDALLIGGSGDDSLIMTGGVGTLNGGKGSDTFEFTYSADKPISAVIEDLDPANDKIIVNFDGDIAPQLSSVASGNDVVWKDGNGLFNLTLKGIRENDYFDGTISEEAWEVLKITNAEREKQNLSPLTMAEGLMTGAITRAEEITELDKQDKLNVFKHTRPNGEDYKTVLVDENLSLEEKYSSYGENLQAGAESPEEVMTAWINSPRHKANILDERFRKLGVGYNYDNESDQSYYWTQLFADSLKASETVSTDELLTATIERNRVSKFISDIWAVDKISNDEYGATIDARGGDDSIVNTAPIVSISGGRGKDTITNSGANVTINAGEGNDFISLSSDAVNNLIQYRAGDGSDTITGLNSTSTLSIAGEEFTPVTLDDAIVLTVGKDSITLADATTLDTLNIEGDRSKLVLGTDKNNTLRNTADGATINSGGGNDSIVNSGASVVFVYESGDDTISGFNATSTLKISDSTITSLSSDNDITLNLSTGSIKLLLAASLSSINIFDSEDNPVKVNDAKNIVGTDDAEILSNSIRGATITALGGDDTITNSGRNVTFVYNEGDGNDLINGFKENSTLQIGGGSGTYSSQTGGEDILVAVGDDSITLVGAATLSTVHIDGEEGTPPDDTIPTDIDDEKFITLTAGNDTYSNALESATILALGGNDTITNTAVNVSIDGGRGNDSLQNYGANVTLNGNDGDDFIFNDYSEEDTVPSDTLNSTISNSLSGILIDGTADDDTIYNDGDNVTINALEGNDSINNKGNNVDINGYEGNDSISNTGDYSYINSGEGNDFIINTGKEVNIYNDAGNVTINNSGDNSYFSSYGDGNDLITNSGKNAYIDSYDGDDSIRNSGEEVYIYSGSGNDTITNSGASSTISAGNGDDRISLNSNNNWIEYNLGNNNDTIYGFNETSTLTISGDFYSTTESGNDIIIKVGDGSISLVGAATLSTLNIEGNEIKSDISNSASDTLIEGTADIDYISNNGGSNVTINGNDDSDYLRSYGGRRSLIDGGTGNDSITTGWFHEDSSVSDNSTLIGGEGNDSISNYGGKNVSMSGGNGGDIINNYVASKWNGDVYETLISAPDNVTINGGDDPDHIGNYGGANALINGGEGNDYIYNSVQTEWNKETNSREITASPDNVTINGGNGNDRISNYGGDSVLINGGDDNDTIENYGPDSIIGSDVTMSGGAGNDSIYNVGNNASLSGGDGDDTISNGHYYSSSGDNGGNNVTISGGASNDSIYLGRDKTCLVEYESGDGNDTIVGFNSTSTLSISSDDYSTQSSGNDIIVTVDGEEEIVLKNIYATADTLNINGNAFSLERKVIESTTDSSRIDIRRNSVSFEGGTGSDNIYNYGDNVSINGGAGNDWIYNYGGKNVYISGDDGDDWIYNYVSGKWNEETQRYETVGSPDNATLTGGNGNDHIYNYGSNVLISGDTGNDTITNGGDNVLIKYQAGDGNDFIQGFRADSTLQIGGGIYSSKRSGSDIIVMVGDEEITLRGAATLSSIHIDGEEAPDNTNIIGGKGKDTISNRRANTTILGGAGADSIDNYGMNVSIVGGSGNDTIYNRHKDLNIEDKEAENKLVASDKSWIDGGDGKDLIENYNFNATITGGKGDDTVNNFEAGMVYIYREGDDNDLIRGFGLLETLVIDGAEFTTLKADDDIIVQVGDDKITLAGAAGLAHPNIVNSTEGIDSLNVIWNEKEDSLIAGKTSSNWIRNVASNVTINVGASNDDIYNDGSNVTINAGADADKISNDGSNVSINGGDGNDYILTGDSIFSGVTADGGAGDDTIGNAASKVSIEGGAGNDSIENSGTNVSINGGTGDDEITLSSASKNNFIRYSAGDGNDTIWGIADNDTLNILAKGWTALKRSKNLLIGEDDLLIVLHDAKGSLIEGSILLKGARKKPPKITLGESGTSGGGTGGGMGGNSSSGNGGNGGGSTSGTSGGYSSNSASGSSGNNNSSNGSSGNGNSTVEQIIVDNVVDFSNTASTSEVIDRRGVTEFEVINGTSGADSIYAGDGGAQLWGGNDVVSDTLVGGLGKDTFICSKNQGAELILNVAPKDTIFFNDATIDDVISAVENNLTISVQFNTGNVVTVKSPELLSAKLQLADGNAYRFNHMGRNWQKA